MRNRHEAASIWLGKMARASLTSTEIVPEKSMFQEHKCAKPLYYEQFHPRNAQNIDTFDRRRPLRLCPRAEMMTAQGRFGAI